MPEYRIYCIDKAGHIHGVREAECGDDAAACSPAAATLLLGYFRTGCELVRSGTL
jgi:hypothetical protein